MCDLDGAKTSLESLLDEVRDLKAERDMWRTLAVALADESPCWYDHHGYCQAHSLHSLHEKPCPHDIVQQLLKQALAGKERG